MTTSLTGTESNKTKGAIPNDELGPASTPAPVTCGAWMIRSPTTRAATPTGSSILFPNGIDGVAAEAQTRWVLFMCDTFAVRVEVDLLEEARRVRAWISAHPERAPSRANLAAYFSRVVGPCGTDAPGINKEAWPETQRT